MHTLSECGKTASAHTDTHDYCFVSVFSTKKKLRSKENDDATTCSGERANRAGETTKRKACPTGSGNREEKVCMYMPAIE